MTARLWAPSPDRVARSRVFAFCRFCEQRHPGNQLKDYGTLQRWSVEAPVEFWSAVWDFCGVVAQQRGDVVLADGDQMREARWFPQTRLSFSENLLRYRGSEPALIGVLENGQRRELSRDQLYTKVAQLAASLRDLGLVPGDRVVGYLPNVPEAVIAMLACASLGAVWSSCSPDFGLQGVLDRFGQIEPRVLFACDGYYYNGERHDTLARLTEMSARIESLEQVVVVPVLSDGEASAQVQGVIRFDDFLADAGVPVFAQLPFDHPLYVLYSSGTTGAPKCIVHGVGGTLLQHLKEHQLACDIGPGDVVFYFTTCGWMMWNWLVSALASGATLVLYDGSPLANEGRVLLDLIDAEGITVFGTSAKYIAALEKAGLKPRESHHLDSMRTLLSTGSPLSHESFEFIYRDIKRDICVSSISGGTDIISCFVGGSPMLPVYAGEIQCLGLGMAVEFWSQAGRPLERGKGELVCTRPFPSMPIGFWNDPDGARYQAAYYDQFEGVWSHGDYGELTDHGGVIIHGRSDAVLNPGGVRIGTAEIYRQVEKLDEVLESVAIGQDWGGDVRVVLFVVLRHGLQLDQALKQKIRDVIRSNTSPRHVPSKILAVSDIPRTLSGKIVELAVRDVVHGRQVNNTDALANPHALELFRDLPDLDH